MQLLKDRIIKDGKVFPGNILKVDSFLNHQMDIELLEEIGKEFHRIYSGVGVTKILTIEASGIGIACFVAQCFGVPLLFAKKSKTKNKTISDSVTLEQGNVPTNERNSNDIDFDYISDDIQRLANLAVYVNYYLYPTSPKNFCWDLFGDGIVLNIYDKSNKEFKIPILDKNGSIEYMGKKYENREVRIECQ